MLHIACVNTIITHQRILTPLARRPLALTNLYFFQIVKERTANDLV
jgi:hypothetical protein